MQEIEPNLTIPEDELDERFIHASGPGSQNVAKVATAVQLRFNATISRTLPPNVRERLLSVVAGYRLTADGSLVITARRFRTQKANRRDARARLAELIAKASKKPKQRYLTRPTPASHRRRLQAKTQRATIKRQRSERPDDDT